MKIATVYTSTTPELLEMVDSYLRSGFGNEEITILRLQDPSILQEARDNGGVTHGCARRLVDLYERAVNEGADILLSVCSSVGDVAALAKPLYEAMGIKFIRIDEDMALSAIQAGTRIGVIATLSTTLEPTKRLLLDCAARLSRHITLVDGLVNAFCADQATFKQMLIDKSRELKDSVDVLLFAQGSMAYAEDAVREAIGIPVYSSIRFGTKAVKDAADLIKKQ